MSYRVPVVVCLLAIASAGCVPVRLPRPPGGTVTARSTVVTEAAGGASTAVSTSTTRTEETAAAAGSTPGSLPRALRPGVKIALVPVENGFDEPVLVTHAGDGTGRLFVVEKAGRVRSVDGAGVAPPGIFLDIRGLVGSSASEQGLLGLAFHPRYPADDRLFVNYTDADGDTVVSAFRAPLGRATVDASGEYVILTQDQPAGNHNGGNLVFGPDGYLYIGFGDGGGNNRQNGQAPDTWLGKLLRIDVDGSSNVGAGTGRSVERRYGIPQTNPFARDAEFLPETWAWGLRNPWRFAFDRLTGDLYVGDVGAGAWEEIDFEAAPAPGGPRRGGRNYGWPIFEGEACSGDDEDCAAASGLAAPILTYPHEDGQCSVTGGHVYRGRFFPALWGVYLYGDYCSGRIWGAARDAAGVWQSRELLDSDLSISSFGEDGAGEVYVVDADGGGVYRITVVRSPG